MAQIQISYGGKGSPSARLPIIALQQADEIAAQTGESRNEVLRRAIGHLWDTEVWMAQAKKIASLEAALLECEAALVEAANK